MYDIFILIFVLLITAIAASLNFLVVGVEKIKKEWPMYKCNPMIMPFAGTFGYDPMDNFTSCISEIQTMQMGKFLNPINLMMDIFRATIDGAFSSIDNFRKKISSMSGNILGIFEEIFGIFKNLIIAFQGIMIRMKDMMAKLTGTMSLMMYTMDGMQKTGQSAWNGPFGKTLRKICFHPDTNIRLLDGTIRTMKNLKIDDVLEDGSVVYATLKLKGNKDMNDESGLNDYYKIYDTKYGEYVYVTGEHLIYDAAKCGYVKVKNYPMASHEKDKSTDFVYCCITDTHKIQLGNLKFWDWDDPVVKPSDNIIDIDE